MGGNGGAAGGGGNSGGNDRSNADNAKSGIQGGGWGNGQVGGTNGWGQTDANNAARGDGGLGSEAAAPANSNSFDLSGYEPGSPEMNAIANGLPNTFAGDPRTVGGFFSGGPLNGWGTLATALGIMNPATAAPALGISIGNMIAGAYNSLGLGPNTGELSSPGSVIGGALGSVADATGLSKVASGMSDAVNGIKTGIGDIGSQVSDATGLSSLMKGVSDVKDSVKTSVGDLLSSMKPSPGTTIATGQPSDPSGMLGNMQHDNSRDMVAQALAQQQTGGQLATNPATVAPAVPGVPDPRSLAGLMAIHNPMKPETGRY